MNPAQPDSEYPEWLWRLHDPLPTKQELLREAQEHFDNGGYEEVLDKMGERDLRRLFKLDAKERIKSDNARRRGGRVV